MWNLLKGLGNFYLYSSLHIALCAGLLTAESYYLLNKDIQWTFVLFISLSTMAVYSAHRLVGMSKVRAFSNEGRYKVIKKYRHHILVYFVISFVFSSILFFKLDFRQMLMMILPALLTGAYVLPIFKQKRLRDFPFIKIFLIALVWTWLTLVLLINQQISTFILAIIIERILFFIAITIPFDIRDVEVDKTIQVKTLIHKLGINRAKYLALFLLAICSMILVLLYYREQLSTAYFISLIVSYILAGILILFSSPAKEDYYFGGLLDATIGLRYLILLLILAYF